MSQPPQGDSPKSTGSHSQPTAHEAPSRAEGPSRAQDAAELAQTLFEEAGDALLLFDPDTEAILDANPMAQRLTGHSRQQLLRLKITYLFRAEEQGGLARLRNAFRKTGLFHSQEGYLLRHQQEGRWLPVNLTVTRLHTEPETLGLITARDMQEQRAAQAQLKKAEAELRRVLASVSDCLWSAHIDAKGRWRLEYCSPVVEMVTGRPAEFFTAAPEPWYSIIHPQDLERVRQSNRNRADGTTTEEEYRIVRPDGDIRWVRSSVHAHQEPGGGLHLDGVLTDITDRKLAADALEKSQRLILEQFVQLQSLFNNTPVALGLLDDQLRYVMVNERLAQINGIPSEQHVGRSVQEIVPTDVWLAVEPALRAAVEQAQPTLNLEFRRGLPHAPEDIHDWLVSYHPNIAADGAVIGVYAVIVDITQLKQAQDKLGQSEKQYRDLVETSNDLIWAVDLRGRATFVNRNATQQIFGFEPEEIIGRHFTDFQAPAQAAKDQDMFARVLAGAQQQHYETTFIRRDGSIVELQANSIVLRDETGQPIGITGTATDITRVKKNERALRDSAERYRLLFERNLAGVFRTRLDGRLLDCNDSFVRILGYESRDDILTHSAADFYMEPADRTDLLARLAENPVLTNFEIRMRRKDGTPIWILENVSRIDVHHDSDRSNDGHAASEGEPFLEGTIVDIDQQKHALEALRASEATYRSLIENLEQAVFLKDRDLRFVAVNRNFCEALGHGEADILGKTDTDFYPTDLAAKYRSDDLCVLREGNVLRTEEQNLQQGKLRTVRVIKTPVKDALGRTSSVLGIFWDVTEQLSIEAQLRQAQKMEAIGQLAGGVAHDFNNLLTVILGNLSYVLGRQHASLDAVLDLLRNAEQAGLRAADLTQRLLGFSRRTMLRSQALNLNQAIDETVRFLRRTIDPRIEVITVTPPDLGLVVADPGMMNQVLMNLALNARDAMPQGGRLYLETTNFVPDDDYLRLHLEARPGQYVRLRVRDTGAGMSPEVRQRIFEPFFTTKDVGKGTGLGLAMVFGIVKQHHGWIECHSEVGLGTTFDIFLPRHLGEAPSDKTVLPPAVPKGHETILLIDDEAMIRDLATLILRRLGYDVLQAEDGLQAVETFRAVGGKIDLVILDGTMPRLSGRDTLHELVRLDPAVRVLFSSGYSTDHHELAGIPQIVGYIQKPFRAEELGLKVREILDKARKAS